MRRLWSVLIVAVVAGVALPATAQPQKDRGSYDVTAQPLPSRGAYTMRAGAGSPYCIYSGVEGVHKVTRRFTAPSIGTMTLRLPEFTGDWELAILDEKGKYLGYGGWNDQMIGAPAGETVVARLQPEQTVRLVACNQSSTDTTVRVHYSFRRGLEPPTPKVARGLAHVAPNQPADLREQLDVNVVFVGYQPRQVPLDAFLEELPKTNSPNVRMPYFYGLERPVGVSYTYRYHPTFAGRAYDDRFFSYLSRIARPARLTAYQRAYNAQNKNVRDVRDNHVIDAPSVERWLAMNPPAGVDTTKNTVFFVNWFGRPDFKHHVYTKQDESETDVGYTDGAFDYSTLMAWGGTPADDPESGLGVTRRVWFHDLSAGPEYWTRNYLVDKKDTDGDGVENYRMPPVWEYGDEGYRDADELAGDLSKITRWVAVNLLFTPAPLYDAALTAPVLPKTIGVNVNLFDFGSGQDLSQYFEPRVFRNAVQAAVPHSRLHVHVAQRDVTGGRAAPCFAGFEAAHYGVGCFAERPYPDWANPFVHTVMERDALLTDPTEPDYQTAIQNYVPRSDAWQTYPVTSCWAFADDNWRDGTQSFVVNHLPSWCLDYLGFTDLSIHEFGHHIGLSHPHDGFDHHSGRAYSSYQDDLQFVAVGDQVNSMMSYLWVNNEFSQFDRDNMNRWTAAAYVTQVNTLAERLLSAPPASGGRAALLRADELVGKTKRAFAAHDYAAAVRHGGAAYDVVLRTLRAAGIAVIGSDRGQHVDPPRGAGSPSGSRPGAVAERLAATLDVIRSPHAGPGPILCPPTGDAVHDPGCALPEPFARMAGATGGTSSR